MKYFRIHELIEESKLKGRLEQGRKVTQMDLAKAAGVDQASISAIAIGKTKNPRMEVLQAIADVFSSALHRKITINDLLIKDEANVSATPPASAEHLADDFTSQIGLEAASHSVKALLGDPQATRNILNGLQALGIAFQLEKERQSEVGTEASMATSRQKQPGLTLVAQGSDDDSFREYFKDQQIPLIVANIDVTIEPNNEEIVLHFDSQNDLNGLNVRIFTVSQNGRQEQEDRSVIRTIKGTDVKFHLGDNLGIEMSEVGKVRLGLQIGALEVKAKLYNDSL